MNTFPIPQRENVSPANQTIFDGIKKSVGFVPNLYAIFAHSENALGNYLNLQSGKSTLRAKEKEVISLVVSQLNNCEYCLSAHTAIARLNGFSDEQILQIRRAEISFDRKLDALAKLVKAIVEERGFVRDELLQNFYFEGYTEASLVETTVAVGDKVITNYLHALTKVPVDWPVAPKLDEAAAA